MHEFWIDKTAREILEREKVLKKRLRPIRVECGIGASGIPHVGSMSDAARAYGVALALEDLGVKSEFIAFSDDRDGLRRVPLGLPNWLENDLAKPVTNIKDPFGCHSSYGEHMSYLLIDALEKVGIKFKFMSATRVYKKGLLNEQVHELLMNGDKVGKIVEKLTGQKKYVEMLPYFPVCESCGRIYTTRVLTVFPKEHRLLYICDQSFHAKNKNTGKDVLVKGCGYEGEKSYFNSDGKLNWKCEFAARWHALKISFEAYGKDIADSVKVNDAVCRKILKFEPPMHLMYEMFLDKAGKKISKSVGNVFTPQVWLRYGSPESLLLLMFKRFVGTRELDVTDIPAYMDEVDRLQRIYFGLEKVRSKRDLINLRRLFEYIYLLNPPKKPSLQVPYSSMMEIAKVLPQRGQLEFAAKKLIEQGFVKELTPPIKAEIKERLEFVKNWLRDFGKPKKVKVMLSANERKAIEDLIKAIEVERNGEKLQSKLFEIARINQLNSSDFFKLLYKIIIGTESGPRLGPYLIEVGKRVIMEKLKEVL
ncbi:MAG: lysine--tRNA ligase [Candidatus Aenigmarchaeota archaeon]|nr:lysine--tRNA ligase [Candidatus Aenigmarchaeota archaeon]